MSDISYNNWTSMSDKALLETIGRFIQHHRLNQNKSQASVARSAGISRSTLSLLERGESSSINILIQVLRVLDQLHIMESFTVNEEISPIEYARLKLNKKHRARDKNGKD